MSILPTGRPSSNALARRRTQKAKYFGELFPSDAAADPLGTLFREFFQRDRDGNAKGIIVIDLENFE